MSKKIIFLLSLFFYSITIFTSLAEPFNLSMEDILDQERFSNQMYDLLKKRDAIYTQLVQVYEKLPNKNIEPPLEKTFTPGYVAGSTILTGLLASPALTINYLNKYITPEKYQNTVDTISLGTAKVIGGMGAFVVASKGIGVMYDWFKYGSIRKRIGSLNNDLNKINTSISKFNGKFNPSIAYANGHEKLYSAFIEFYRNNHNLLTKKEINHFISTHSDTFFSAGTSYSDNVTYILKIFINEKNKLLLPGAVKSSLSNTDVPLFLAGMSVVAFMLSLTATTVTAPSPLWSILSIPFTINSHFPKSRPSPYEHYKLSNELDHNLFSKVDLADTIIKKLKRLLLDEANNQQPINQQNPVIKHLQAAK
jgi:hypothetical protein